MTVSRRAYEAALDRMEPLIMQAFLDAMKSITSRARIAALERALVSGDLDRALEAIGFNQASLDALQESIRQSFIAGGNLVASSAPAAAAFAFSPNLVGAQNWLRDNGAELVRDISNQMRAVIAETLTEALQVGQGPRSTALDLVGRLNRRIGLREGGLVELSKPFARAVRRMRSELASGDPVLMANYFGRAAADRRFDRMVAKAIEQGVSVSKMDIDRIARAYQGRLLRLRGESIARTETLQSVNAGQAEAVKQAIDQGALPKDETTKAWRTAGDRRVRRFHSSMNGDAVPLDQPFTSGSGSLLRFPGDRGLGAGAEDIIQCRCQVVYRTDWIAAGAR